MTTGNFKLIYWKIGFLQSPKNAAIPYDSRGSDAAVTPNGVKMNREKTLDHTKMLQRSPGEVVRSLTDQ